MNAPTPANENSVFESFPEYNNFPPQWDLSELDVPARPTHNGHGEQSVFLPVVDSTGAETPLPIGDAYPVFSRDPFPKLRTFPVFWDLPR
jgi:hypothetical protein